MEIQTLDLINDLYTNINKQIEYDNQLLDYRRGSLVIKKRRNESYYYLTYREGNKVKTDYLGKLTRTSLSKIEKEINDGTVIRNEIKKLQKAETELRKLISAVDKIALMKDVYEVMDIIVIIRPILKQFKVKKAYLFGDYALGTEDEESPIEIYCDKPDKPVRDLIRRIEKETNKKIIIITTSSRIPDSLLNHIEENKILIYRGN